MLKLSDIWALLVPSGDKPNSIFQQQLHALGVAQTTSFKLNLPMIYALTPAYLYWSEWTLVLAWIALLTACQFNNVWTATQLVKASTADPELPGPVLRRWVLRISLGSAFYNAVWASSLILFWIPGAQENNYFLLAIVAISLTPTVLLNRNSMANFLASAGTISVIFLFALAKVATPVMLFTGLAYIAFVLAISLYAVRLNSSAKRESLLFQEKNELIEALSKAMEESNEARARAEEANKSKSRFLANMSHELRTPLNAIIGFSEMMNKEVFGSLENERYRQYSSDIHESGQHLLALINDVLDISKIEAGQFTIKPERVNLKAIAEEAQKLIELRATVNDISIVHDFVENIPDLEADARALCQIWLNLLTNAVKFAPTGSEIRMLANYTEAGFFFIGVDDKGPGIPENELSTVLETFGQGTEGKSRPGSGTGLGLTIVKGLAEAHGGEFVLESEVGVGTKAIAIFPPNCIRSVHPHSETRRQRAVSYP
jgi:two-component system, cell cycle sensor histidine kinase PleC